MAAPKDGLLVARTVAVMAALMEYLLVAPLEYLKAGWKAASSD
jgi:hypothetical protein